MAIEMAPLQDALMRCNVSVEEPEAADVLRLLRVVSIEARNYTSRDFEGAPTVYTEIVDTDSAPNIMLPHVPVTDIMWVRAAYWDGTQDDIYAPEPVIGGYTTTLATAPAAGATNLRVVSVTGVAAGDLLWLGGGAAQEVVRVTAVGTAGSGGTGLTIEPALLGAHLLGATLTQVSGSTYWRLTSPSRGIIERETVTRFAEVRWRTTGDVPADVQEAILDWVASRWGQRERTAGQSSYSTGADSESWDLSKAGHPPTDTARVLSRYWRTTKSLVV